MHMIKFILFHSPCCGKLIMVSPCCNIITSSVKVRHACSERFIIAYEYTYTACPQMTITPAKFESNLGLPYPSKPHWSHEL